MIKVEITESGEFIEIGTEVTEEEQPENFDERYEFPFMQPSSPIIPSWLFESDT